MASPVSQLADLLAAMFKDQELRRFLEDQGVGDTIPGPGVALSHLAYEGADALRRRGLIDQALFESLASRAGNQRDAVARAAGAFGITLRQPDATSTRSAPSAQAPVASSYAPNAPTEPALILFFASNPFKTARMTLDEETRAIEQRLLQSERRDLFRFQTVWATRPLDIMDNLLRHQPRIVQFSSHGATDGLWLGSDRNPDQPVRVPPEALNELFELHSDTVRCVLLNGCYTADQAEGLARHIDVVVGSEGPLSEESGIVFSSSFYRTLGAGRDVRFAFRSACNAVKMQSLPGPDQFKLLTRDGVDASALRLA